MPNHMPRIRRVPFKDQASGEFLVWDLMLAKGLQNVVWGARNAKYAPAPKHAK